MPQDIEQIDIEGGSGNIYLEVDPSVHRNMYLYGGPGDNTLIGGSGQDTLVGGPGSSVIEGGPGDSDLYGGDGPSPDGIPLDSVGGGTATEQTLTPGRNTLSPAPATIISTPTGA